MEEKAIEEAKRGLAALNSYLESHTYLVGENVTLADIVTASNLTSAVRGLLDAKFLAAYPHVNRYFWTLVNQPAFKAVVGEVEQVS